MLNGLSRFHSLWVFLILWLATGITINLNDQRAFTLQQMGVDAIVSYQTYTLGHSQLDILTPRGDTFYAEKGILPAKQPGQFAIAAVPYWLLKSVGISYENNYDQAASWVTWLSTSLLAALALTCLYRLLLIWGFKQIYALSAVLSAGLASHWLVFAGISHHDILATSLLIFALAAAEKNHLVYQGNNLYWGVLSGLFAGLIVFTSMLPALLVVAFGCYIFASLNPRTIASNGVGFALGLLPLAWYNYHYFGNPLTQANVAGNYADTFFNFSWQQFSHHLNAYWGNGGLSLWKYSPIITLGFIGVWFLPRSLTRIKIFIVLATLLHMAYLLNIETLGTCQYGPRYLLPLVPLFAIGLPVILQLGGERWQYLKGSLFGAIAGYSCLVSLIGAFAGAMQCDLNRFTGFKYLTELQRYHWDLYPFFVWMLPLLLSVILLAIFSYGATKTASETTTQDNQ